jgi:hypothetical protein
VLHRGAAPHLLRHVRQGAADPTPEAGGQVPILPKVTYIGLQIFVTCKFYIFVTFNQYVW